MNNFEFVKKLGEFCGYENISITNHKSTNINNYINKVRLEGKEPELDSECIEFFKNLDLDITDSFTVNIISIGGLQKSKESIYSINISKDDEIVYSMIFNYEIDSDDKIDLLMNSICKAMYLRCFRAVNVKFIFVYTK